MSSAHPLLARLQSAPLAGRIEATYKLDYDDFENPLIRDAVRDNLNATDADLLEITIMRLLIRGKDVESVGRVLEILSTTQDDLVFSAAVLALVSVWEDLPVVRSQILATFETLPSEHLSIENSALFAEALCEVRSAEPS